jgi:hypothetical protein
MKLAGQAGTAIHVATVSRAVREGEERYRRLVETSPDAIFLTDVEDGRIQICNEQTLFFQYGLTWQPCRRGLQRSVQNTGISVRFSEFPIHQT